MAVAIQLLKQARNSAAWINGNTGNPEYKALLNAIDVVLNKLMSQEQPKFYVDYVATGQVLLKEGRALATKLGGNGVAAETLRDDVSADLSMTVINAEITKLHEAMRAVVGALDEGRSKAEKDFLVRMTDWETSLYDHDLEQVPSMSDDQPVPITAERLQNYLAKKFPAWKNVKVTRFMQLDGGFSKKTILFETDDELNGHQSLVMRAEQATNMLFYEGSDVRQEFYMIQLMQKAGLPIAEPQWLEADTSHLGTRFIISKKAIGKVYGGALGTDEPMSKELVHSMIGTFIKLHNIKVDPNDPLTQKSHLKEWLPTCRSMRDTTHYYITQFLPRIIRLTKTPPSPQLLRALKWLEKNIPDSGDQAPVIIHLDFSFNNLIIGENGISAVLDWESSRLADPSEDIIWTQMNLGAFISMPEFLKLYEEGTGRHVTEYQLAYSRVAKMAINAVSCFSSMQLLDADNAAHINMCVLAYKYLALFGSKFNEAIAEAERVKPR